LRHVIIGNGITGITAAQVLRQRDEDAEIVIVGDETRYFYARTALMWIYMRQLTARATEPLERWFWRENRFTLVHDRVTALDTERKTLSCGSGRELSYDTLLLAVGASPNMFGWPGQDLSGVCNMTSMGDLAQLESVRPRLRSAVVVGGGLIGIEMVEMMLHDRVPVTYLVREPWYWNLVLSREEGEIVHARMRHHGVNLILEDEIGTIDGDDDGRVKGVSTRKGVDLPCQLVGIAVGVHPNLELARDAGIECGRGILVDEAMRTSAPGVFAAGDCAEIKQEPGPGRIEQLWYTGVKQGRVAGRSMVGDRVAYDPGVPYNSAQFLFLDYANVGWMNLARHPPPASLTGRQLSPEDGELGLEEVYHRAGAQERSDQCHGAPDSIRVSFLPETGQVMGFSTLGSRWDSRVLMRWIEERRPLEWALRNLDRAQFNEEFRTSRFAGGIHA
jgi:NADPH-dependent 2,4-dienoyl-CoA reductase/sulfur reductase-like enzyme